MSLFDSRRPKAPKEGRGPEGPIPTAHIDVSKRYDVYCSSYGEERVYEDIRFVAMRTFEPLSEYSTHVVGGYLELEAQDGSRIMIPTFGIQLICEHGIRPSYMVVRRWANMMDY